MNAYNTSASAPARWRSASPPAPTELRVDWCAAAPPVRPADHRVPGPAVDARRHVDQASTPRAPGLRRRAQRRANGFPDPCPRRAGQGVHRRDRDQDGQRGAAAVRRARLQPRAPDRAHGRDVRMFTIGGGTAEVLRTQVASRASAASCRRRATAMWSADLNANGHGALSGVRFVDLSRILAGRPSRYRHEHLFEFPGC